jgi:hypothetical protein
MSPRGVRLAILVPFALGLVLFSAAAPPPAAAAETVLNASLEGSAEVPVPGDPDGFGEFAFFIDPAAGTVCWDGFWEGIDEPTMAHIHAGASGEAGPVVVALEPFPPEPTGCVDSQDETTLQAIVDNAGDYYANIHNATHPDGAIRGQLAVAPTLLFFELSGSEEVPGPGDPDGDGAGTVELYPDGSICYAFDVQRLDTVTAAHIHTGAAGVAGPVAVPLDLPVDGFSSNCVDIDPGVFAAIMSDPAGHYVNVHTTAYPDGAIRGQLTDVETPFPTFLFADMNGSNEVPGPGDPDGLGIVQVELDPHDGTACADWLQLRDVEPAVMAHIHAGAAGVSGPVVVPLAIPEAGGCTVGHDPALLQAIVDDPAAYYVNLHTASFPDGAIRGQLAVDPPPGLPCIAPEICNGPMPPGTYVFTGFDRSVTITTDNEWIGFLVPNGFSLELPDNSGALYFYDFDGWVGTPPCGDTQAPIAVSAASFTSWLGAHPLVEASDVTNETLGGLPGLQIEVVGALDGGCFGRAFLITPNGVPDFFWFWIGEGERVRVTAQDVASTVLTLVDDFDGDSNIEEMAQSELESMVWGDQEIPDTAMPEPGSPPATILGAALLMLAVLSASVVLARRPVRIS